jgi:DNA polymerase-3 subunit epsilon
MIREIILDTETTGLDARKGDRLIEIGCIELVNHIPTGREFHRFLNPETRDVHPDAEAIHGISTAFLKDKPLFRAVAADFLEFIGDDPLVIHNAMFDIGFINMELERVGRPALSTTRIVDTLMLARRKHPGGPNTLDGLCRRFGIDNSKRDKHGAIVDSLLLAQVYVELIGARQADLGLQAAAASESATLSDAGRYQPARARPQPLLPRLSPEAADAHAKFVETLGGDPLWKSLRVPAG